MFENFHLNFSFNHFRTCDHTMSHIISTILHTLNSTNVLNSWTEQFSHNNEYGGLLETCNEILSCMNNIPSMILRRIFIIGDENVTISTFDILCILWVIPLIFTTCHMAIRVLLSVVYLRWRDTPGARLIYGPMSPVLNRWFAVRKFWNFWRFGFVLFGLGVCMLWYFVPLIVMIWGDEELSREVIGCSLAQSGGLFAVPALMFWGHMPSHCNGSFNPRRRIRFWLPISEPMPRRESADGVWFKDNRRGPLVKPWWLVGYGGGIGQEVITSVTPLCCKVLSGVMVERSRSYRCQVTVRGPASR